MSNKFKFYSQEEIKDLKPFIHEGLAPIKENLVSFCKKYNRSWGGVAVFVYKERRKVKTTPAKTQQSAILKKSEFHIPIKAWELVNKDGQISLILKFS